MTAPLAEHFFRHEYGRLVATLARRVGAQRLDAVEDAVQAALLAAVESWPRSSLPDNPSAWLYRVAHNQYVEALRRQVRRDGLSVQLACTHLDTNDSSPATRLPGEVHDDLLRMLFVCCDPAIPVDSQLALALRTLCGFDVREIAERLFTTEANVYKRLGRARAILRETPRDALELGSDELPARLSAVLAALYTLFTEGYLSSHPEGAIRRELCDEALRLTSILADHPAVATPETFALLALMHLHHARLEARQGDGGCLLLLEEQDRTLWDRGAIAIGLSWLARAATGQVFSRYHAEAGVAAEHCLAPSLAETRWDRIVECYALLERIAPSPLHTLNRAVAIAELRGPEHALDVLESVEAPSWLRRSYQWSAVLADLHRRAGHCELARVYREVALDAAPSHAVRVTLERRLRAPGVTLE